jgi:broad specificity phosphatase PhoE
VFKEPDRRRVYLLRHAEAAYLNADGTPVADTRAAGLTANGETQARRQAEVLADVGFDRAVCSGLPRTRATAAIILAGRLAPTLEIVPDLEEIRGGDRHQPVADMETWIRHVANPWADAAHPEARFLGGERFVDFERRVVPAFAGLVDDPSWRTLLVVAHGGVNRLLLNHVMNLPWQGAVSVEQDACCINIIDVDIENGAAIRYLVRGINITGYNLNKAGILLTDMERTAQRLAALASPSRN